LEAHALKRTAFAVLSMSVVNPSLTGPSRNISHTVRLAPYLVETLCELTRAVRDKTHAQTEVSGLLFGTADEELTIVEALRTFEDTGPRSDLARRERLDKAFDSAMALADEDTELAACRLVGWFSLRSSSGLLSSDVEFHNRHFKQADDLALVVWREADTQVIAELYARTENRMLSGSDYRWSSVRLSTELRRVSEPIDLAMRAKVTADSYLRAYRGPEENEKQDDWKKIASSAKRTMLSLIPRRMRGEGYSITGGAAAQSYARQLSDTGTIFRRTEGYPEPLTRSTSTAAEPSRVRDVSRMLEPSRAPEPFRAMRYPEGEVSGLPMVINTPKRRAGVPWLSTALVFVTFSAITFAVLAVKGTQSGNGKLAQIMRVIFPSGDLGLHVETQGDRLLLSWNRRNAAVAAAADGVLQIFDGTQHREVRLDGGQVADGSVLYKPVSPDVTFRLEVHGTDRSSAMGSMRVLDATATGRETPVLDLTGSPAAPARTAAAGPPNPIPVPETGQSAAQRVADKPAAPKNAEPGQVVIYRHPNSTPLTPAPVHTIPANSGQTPSQTAAKQTTGSGTLPVQQPPVDAKANASKPDGASDATPAGNPQLNVAAQPPPHLVPARPDSQRDTQRDTQRQTPAASSLQPPAAGSTINGWDPSVTETPRPTTAPETTTPAPTPAASLDTKPPAFGPPKPLLQVMPNTRSLAPGLITQVTRVEVGVRIDNAGRVMSAHVLNESGNSKAALSQAAVAAARQWTFQPATLQGEKVESEHTIVFEFRPENQ
jgi:TonB family protein